ncbi:MaoC family dehydratase [Paeniglutamicibacter sp. MACA_103]|uniref:MaoC family dehydratase n=1 Tax=Paeniglutamicibacter sp. MACA_103 TaxID=3377337 RepID=UPI0038949320
MISKPYEEISIGDIETTSSKTITEEYVRAFAELTGDRHPLHLMPEYAQETRFGKQIAHGALIISTLLGLVELHPSYLQCFYGLNNVEFKAPTYFGDSIHVVTEITSVNPGKSGMSAVVGSYARVINQDGNVVLSGDFSMLVAGTEAALDDPRMLVERVR